MSINADKLKALQLTLDKLEKSYGKGTVMKLGDNPVEPIESISTGSISLDIALGIGGVPKGRVIEIYILNPQVKLLWLPTSLLKHKEKAEWLRLLMLNMHLTKVMQKN